MDYDTKYKAGLAGLKLPDEYKFIMGPIGFKLPEEINRGLERELSKFELGVAGFSNPSNGRVGRENYGVILIGLDNKVLVFPYGIAKGE